MADLSPFLLSQIDKIFENFVRPDKDLQHQGIFASDNLHMHLLQYLPGGGYHCVSDILVSCNIKYVTIFRNFICML